MIAMVVLKNSSWTVTHDVTQEVWCTSSSMEGSHILHTSDLVKAGIAEYNTSYDETVEGSEENIFTHPLHLLCYNDT